MSTNVVKLINPNHSEGLDDNYRELRLAHIRAVIRRRIENPYGMPDRAKAGDIASKHFMCAATVINFAYGETRKPSTWTVKRMALEAGYQMMMVPVGTTLPDGCLSVS